MRTRLIKFLMTLVRHPRYHGRWLNTLSFLEYIGARKIIKSQKACDLDIMILEHMAEETRHAHFFKKLSEKVSPRHSEGHCEGYRESELLSGRQAEKYFQDLDTIVADELGMVKTLLNYLYVTWLVEQRAILVYETYLEVVDNKEIKNQLQAILNEEHHHRDQMQFSIQTIDDKEHFAERMPKFLKEELRGYENLLKNWENSIPTLHLKSL